MRTHVVLKLRDLRIERGWTQQELAARSGIGVKSISSFETGDRIESMKIGQLESLLAAFGVSDREFFGFSDEEIFSPDPSEDERLLLDEIRLLPNLARRALLEKFRAMAETAGDALSLQPNRPLQTFESDWRMLNSQN
ncbi:MAG: helix-turn-helix transcriptional regulator [Thermoanaerobaculia bacterium]